MLQKTLGKGPSPSAPQKRAVPLAPHVRVPQMVDVTSAEGARKAIKQASGGVLAAIQGYYHKMLTTDARVRGLVKGFDSALLASPVRTIASPLKTARSEEIALAVRTAIEEWNKSNLIRESAMAALLGVRLFEVQYELVPASNGREYLVPQHLLPIPGTLLRMDVDEKSPDYGRILVTKDKRDTDGTPLDAFPEGSMLLVTEPGAQKGFYDTAGAFRACLGWFVVKASQIAFWAEFNELYPHPQMRAYMDTVGSEAEQFEAEQQMVAYLKYLRRNGFAVLPKEVELEVQEQARAGQVKTYADLIDLANTEIAIAIQGQTQTSDGGKYGSYAKAQVHNGVRHEILSAAAIMVEEQVFEPVVSNIVRLNFGLDVPRSEWPKVRLVVPNPDERLVKTQVFAGAQALGIQIPKTHALDELGIPEAVDGEEILQPIMPQSPSPGAPGGTQEGAVDDEGDADTED